MGYAKIDDYPRLSVTFLSAAQRAVTHGYRVFILPNPKGKRTADFIFERKGLYRMYDLKTIQGKSSIVNRLAESIGQTNHVLLNMATSYNMSAKQLQHCMRASKNAKGLVVSNAELIAFPKARFVMDLYYDGECFIYTDGLSKYIVHPNYKVKVSREMVKLVNFITATRRTDKYEFNGKRYVKIGNDRTTE